MSAHLISTLGQEKMSAATDLRARARQRQDARRQQRDGWGAGLPASHPRVQPDARQARSIVATNVPTRCHACDRNRAFHHFPDGIKSAILNSSISPRRHSHRCPNCVRITATSMECMAGISHKLPPVIFARTIQNHTMPEPIAAKPLHTSTHRNWPRRASRYSKALRSARLNAGVAMSISNANNDTRIKHAPMCTARVTIMNMFSVCLVSGALHRT